MLFKIRDLNKYFVALIKHWVPAVFSGFLSENDMDLASACEEVSVVFGYHERWGRNDGTELQVL